MTALLEGVRKLVSRGGDIGALVEGLEIAVEGARGRLDDALVEQTAAVVERAAGRLRLSADHTVVAIAGATGSGKSSTFNALAGLELAAVGVRRPTTSWATACVWGSDPASELLEWLGIPPRHQITRDSMLDVGRGSDPLDGLVLLDLPDHDSTEVAHHLEVDRLVNLADLLVWVLDPQKYADAAIHDRYLATMAHHQDVMLVVLNHLDAVAQEERQSMLADVRRLLAQDGLTDVPVLGMSATLGWGVEELRTELAARAAAKKAARARLAADLRAAAHRLHDVSGDEKPRTLPKLRVDDLDVAFAEAAGVPTVVAAVEASTRIRANRATGWPVTAWLSRLRPDPLKRLHLDLGAAGRQLTGTGRTSIPEATQVERARVDTAVRALADDVSGGLTRPWVRAIRAASTARLSDLGDRLDLALASTDLGVDRMPRWAGLVRAVQWLLTGAAVLGGVWLAVLAVLGYLQLPEPGTLEWRGLPWPTLLLVGGVFAGVVLALLCRVLVRWTARSRARAAERRLRAAIREVSAELVVGPIEAELAAYDRVRNGLAKALR